ncbi:trehalose synthase [Thermococcus thioreducens]|uniref:Glycosyl transferase family 1 n=1 Tax=Thermococcus thioreducens TaxID=277988 RepID=A0A0Q2QNX5_9EURY|nr:trehalose synthase [Thermococcus thioreducens]ASJ12176.1 glycosyl transferase family 1 [Thermococcus thioreducens]KQH81573.1 glycosyl transferase family 1 [Thermococcus thioreducens]SEV95449.1 trehalose synthase (ADP-glucose) [Thermococcus thioreducens]
MLEVREFTGVGKSLKDYGRIIGEDAVERIKVKAERLLGAKFAHVNSTSFGGGVAEILHNLVPLMRDTGLDAKWFVIRGSDEFFNVTKSFHNALQGNKDLKLTGEMKNLYLKTNEENAQKADLSEFDYVLIHDPQPAALIDFYEKTQPWIWRCHIDLSDPNRQFWVFLREYIQRYDRYIFHLPEYVQPDLSSEKTVIMPPSIDPLSEKNMELKESEVLKTLERFDVDPDRPIIIQVARFDPWKGVFDVIEVYRKVKEKIPEVQLLLVGVMAADDPEGWVYFEKTLRKIGEDYDVKVLTNLTGVHAREVNAFQRASDVVLQMSIREGFGLTVTEAMWKGKPVVGRAVGGIKFQVVDGETGFLVNGVEEAVERVIYLLKHPRETNLMGMKARKRVLEKFLITRHLERYLDLLNSL